MASTYSCQLCHNIYHNGGYLQSDGLG